MDVLFAFIFGLITILPLMLLRAWVLVKGWAWFIVPLGVPNISIPQMIGINLFILCILAPIQRTEKKLADNTYPQTTKVFANTIESVFVSLICWGFFAIAHAYM